MYSQTEEKAPILNAFILSLPSIISLFISPYASDIKEGINFQLFALNSNLGFLQPNSWVVILVLIYLAIITCTVFSLKKLFIAKPRGWEWVSNIIALVFIIPTLCIELKYIFQLTDFFLSNI